MSAFLRRYYRFGEFTLDAQTRELYRHGVPVALTSKAFDVLRELVENRDRVVGRDELLATVWAGRVVVENNLTQAVTALRSAFGTGAGDHRYIVTVPGRGYRFVAEVEEPGMALVPASDSSSRSRRLISAGLPLLLAGVLGVWLGAKPRPAKPPAEGEDGRP